MRVVLDFIHRTREEESSSLCHVVSKVIRSPRGSPIEAQMGLPEALQAGRSVDCTRSRAALLDWMWWTDACFVHPVRSDHTRRGSIDDETLRVVLPILANVRLRRDPRHLGGVQGVALRKCSRVTEREAPRRKV